ncbi:hypothetical protein ABB29_05005 [Pseudoxanthomonas dokdonensis]|uniref:Copper resistance protein CopB n=1 Tax=Pseudoxanthomonas dokdonensis TaxID=344882 RepID=A0A0R0CNJ9_9GAMM|nr:hypothetical protein ABB29_05005 [Pseudoxanthomonas dokdonensis]
MPAWAQQHTEHQAHQSSSTPAEAAAHDHAAHAQPTLSLSTDPGESHAGHGGQEAAKPLTPIPLPSDADRAAAFAPLAPMHMHGDGLHSYWLTDRLEVWDADEGRGWGWETSAWAGSDLNRVWLRSEGESVDGKLESGNLELLYGRSVSAWWDVVAGIRHDFGEAASQDFLAIGVQGLAPYKFEVQATAYIGEDGQGAFNFEIEYDTLLSNRWILQWQAEVELYAKDDAARGIGQGLASSEAGVRLRYEISRQFAPYIGVSWERQYGNTADFSRSEGADRDAVHWVAGVRFWF